METIDAIVLHTIDYKDSGKILYTYSKDGHQSLIAYRVKKMNNSMRYLSQPGTRINISTTSGKMKSLKEAEIIDEYHHIKSDITAFLFMSHIMDLTRNVIDDHADHQKMYAFLIKLFDQMNQGQDPELLSFIFELKLLYFIGYGLHFKSCVHCNQTKNLVFHPSSGGLLCDDHRNEIGEVFHQDIFQYLANCYYIDISKESLPLIPKEVRSSIRHILDIMYDEFVGYKTKSRSIIKQFLKY
jgi:DNA repair protein RecO (recombination protein O)